MNAVKFKHSNQRDIINYFWIIEHYNIHIIIIKHLKQTITKICIRYNIPTLDITQFDLSLNVCIFFLDWETCYQLAITTYINLIPLCNFEFCLVTELACSYSKYTRIFFTCNDFALSLRHRQRFIVPIPTSLHRFSKS